MALVGYARVSSAGQSLEVQRELLLGAGVEPDHLFEEKRSGVTVDGREKLQEALRFSRKGDVFLVTRLDRLARSVKDLLTIIDQLKAKGAGFRVLQQAGVDTTTPQGELFLHILAAFAQWENAIRKERQREGIEKAKAEGRFRGGKPSVPVERVRELKAAGVRPVEIARQLGIGRASVYRALEEPGEPEAA